MLSVLRRRYDHAIDISTTTVLTLEGFFLVKYAKHNADFVKVGNKIS
jgi:hypothetical protein